jgi:polyribonucleotide nucleotidyltransferase
MQGTQRFSTQWAGKELIVETGVLAQQAGAAVTVQHGDTVIFATATISKERREGLPFFPLMVEYQEKLYANGQIKGSRFIKREGRPSDEAVLTSRMIDRALRPLFDDRIRNEIQVVCQTMSYDDASPVDVIALIAASCALHMSDAPWNGPLAGNRVGLIDGELILHPTIAQMEESSLDLVTAGSGDKVIMVECGAHEVPKDMMDKAFKFATQHYAPVIDLIEEVRTAVGKEKLTLEELMPEKSAEEIAAEEVAIEIVKQQVKEVTAPWLIDTELPSKKLRKGNLEIVKSIIKKNLATMVAEEKITEDQMRYGMDQASGLIEYEVSRAVLERDRRVDGRSLTDIRELSAQINLFPRVHGSGLFSRGETQILTIATLGSPGDAQIIDELGAEEKKRYMHHYNFPAYSVGEVAPFRGTGRREIGHGALAEKALMPVLPSQEEFPYTIRLVSETMGSNGSSSMGSTCGSTLALLAAGVPIKRHIAGIAIGLISDEAAGQYKVITDLQDLEDGNGGMDFKVTGSVEGFTAIQLDTKTTGLPPHVITEALNQAADALVRIVDVMKECIDQPQELSEYAPRILSLRIEPEKIGAVIGTGGKVINGIIDETGVAIDIEDDGLVMITGAMEGALKAKEIIENIVKDVAVGEEYEGKVVRIMDFGAIVEFLPGKDGMVHVSELDWKRTEKVTDVVNVGDVVKVKVVKIEDGKIGLSIKALKPKPEGYQERPPRGPRPPHGGGNRGGGRPQSRPHSRPQSAPRSLESEASGKTDDSKKKKGLFGFGK